jgi:minor extracellular serine protease Vpr
LKKNIFLLIVVLLFQFVIGSLPDSRIFALQLTEQSEIINQNFLSEVSSLKSLVPVIIELKQEPTLDYFQAWKDQMFIESNKSNYRDSIISYQDSWLKKLQNQGISFFRNGSCTDTINMISIQIKGTDVEKISADHFVKRIYDDRMKVKPYRSIMAQSTGTETVWKGLDTLKSSGKNVVVGIIDTGIDGDHPEFRDKIMGGKNYIGEGTYKTDSYIHGTHVAGIIGGLGDSSHGKGMAPGVKFYIYKALSIKGGSTSSIMEAMDQAVKDKCQIINMSLGRIGGEDSKSRNPYYSIIKRIVEANVVLVAASGNSGARGKNVPWPAGSPGIVEDSFCVAASNDRNIHITYSSKDRAIQGLYDPIHEFNFKEISTEDIVDCKYGSNFDFSNLKLTGKIALIKRGPILNPISFSDKMKEAKKAGARAVVFVDYQNNSTQLPKLQFDFPLPYLYISADDGRYLSTQSHSEEVQSLLQIEGLNMAEFSSMGLTPDGVFKPEITAPGVDIMSTLPKKNGSYYAMSGTSMACPSISGQVALIKEVHPDWKVDQIKSAMMNTAYILMNPVVDKPVTFMLQGAGQSRVDKAIQTPAFIMPRAFVIENSMDTKLSFTVTNATKDDFNAKVSVEYFIDSGEESPAEINFDKTSMKIPGNGNSAFSATIKMNKDKFFRPRIEGVIWINDLHVPFIILRESSVNDNNKALKNPVSDIFCNTQQVNYNEIDKPIRVNFSFNTGTEQKFEGEISYSNYGSVKIFLTDPQGLLWDARPIKEFNKCVIGDYTFDWNMMTGSKEYLPNGKFSLKFECSASDDNEIVSEPLMIINSPQESLPSLILASPRYQVAESTFSLDLYIQSLINVKEIDYTLYFDTKKLRIDKAEKSDHVISWDDPIFKSDSIRLKMTQFSAPEIGKNRTKLATIYFVAKGIGSLKFSNKVYVTIANDKKIRTLGLLPDVQITKKAFLLGDINNDKQVDMHDYFLVAKSMDTISGEILFKADYDLNQDLIINQLDLDIILEEIEKQI